MEDDFRDLCHCGCDPFGVKNYLQQLREQREGRSDHEAAEKSITSWTFRDNSCKNQGNQTTACNRIVVER